MAGVFSLGLPGVRPALATDLRLRESAVDGEILIPSNPAKPHLVAVANQGGFVAVQGSPMKARPDVFANVPPRPDVLSEYAALRPRIPPTPVSNQAVRGPSGSPTVSPSIGLYAPGDFVLFTNSIVSPTQLRSTVNEPSVANWGRVAFYTGNWYAARSGDFGATWSYVNPFSDMPDFCCDQDVLYEPSRGIFLWYRQGLKDSAGVNRFRLGVSLDAITWWFYDVRPVDVNAAWTNQWFDYPHLDVSSNYVYISTNIFNNADLWQRTLILRWPLDPLKNAQGFTYFYFSSSLVFTFATVGGAASVMYFASHVSNSVVRIFSWPEASTAVSSADVAIPAYTPSSKGSMSCPGPDGFNWCARSDDRILSGWVARGVIGFVWNVAQGGGFSWPYVEAATFDEATKAYRGRPLVWSPSNAWMYPAVHPNARGDLGVLAFWGSGTVHPSAAMAISDAYSGAPPPWTFYSATQGSNGPSDNQWGDYARVRPFRGAGTLWAASGYTLSGGTTGASAVPRYYVFGRWDDIPLISFQTTPASCGSIIFDGKPYVHAQNVQRLPESYSVAAATCAGYTLSSLTVSGGISITGTVAAVSGSGTIAASFVDVTPPVVSIESPLNGALVNNPSLDVTGSASDLGSGIMKVEVRVNVGVWNLAAYSAGSWSARVSLQEWANTICARATDNAGNVGPPAPPCVVVSLDTTPPSTTASLSGTAGQAGWYVSPVTVALQSSDTLSGVASVSYRLDAGAWQRYADPFAISTDGVHVVEYFATDVAGNREVTKSATVKIDRAPPMASASSSGTVGLAGWYLSGATVAISATDAVSGVASIEYRVDGGGWTTYAAPFSVISDGSHIVEYRATDAAGNVEVSRSLTVKVDQTLPTLDVTAPAPGSWTRESAVTVTWVGMDTTSGIDRYEVAIDGGPPEATSLTQRRFAGVGKDRIRL